MVTRETTVHVGDYELRFTVYDDGDIYAVTIASKEIRIVNSSQELNWDRMLAGAINALRGTIHNEAVKELIVELQESDFIDNNFIKYL